MSQIRFCFVQSIMLTFYQVMINHVTGKFFRCLHYLLSHCLFCRLLAKIEKVLMKTDEVLSKHLVSE